MAEVKTFTCEARARSGTGGSRAVRRDGWVPAVIYGGDDAPKNIKLKYNEILKAYNTGQLIGIRSQVNLDGEEINVVGRDIQIDPVKDFPMHVDFLRVNSKTRINVEVPVNIIGEEECPGLRAGGVLNIVRHAVEVIAPALSIPENIEVSIEGLNIGDSVHISSTSLPEGVTPKITDRDFVILTIASPTIAASTEDDESEEETEEDTTEEAAPTEE